MKIKVGGQLTDLVAGCILHAGREIAFAPTGGSMRQVCQAAGESVRGEEANTGAHQPGQ